MGNQQCDTIDKKDIVLIEKINKQKKMYALTNRISRFPPHIQETIEQMFILKQIHICDRIVSLMNSKRKEQAQKLIKDLQGFNCEEFDELYYFSSFSDRKSQKPHKLKKIGDKYLDQGLAELTNARIAFIIPIQCFWHRDVLSETDLLSRKSKLQFFLQKIQAFRHCHSRFDETVMVYLITPPNHLTTVSKTVNNNIRLVSYQTTFPCFNHGGKIALFGNNIEFNETDGDLMHFMMTNQTLSQVQTKFDYICFNNIHNFIQPVIQPKHIGYLKQNQQQEILVTIRYPEQLVSINRFIKICEDNDLGTCLMKSSFVRKNHQKQNNSYQIFSQQIRQVRVDQSQDKFFFGRNPRDVLYSPCTTVTGVSGWADDKIQFSEYCKDLLRISKQNSEDIVEICPQILYGNPQKMRQLRHKLQQGQGAIGYPLIVMKVKQNKN